jgi:hypothetical protein
MILSLSCRDEIRAHFGRGGLLRDGGDVHRAGFLVAATAAWASQGLDTSLHDAGSVRATMLMSHAAQ